MYSKSMHARYEAEIRKQGGLLIEVYRHVPMIRIQGVAGEGTTVVHVHVSNRNRAKLSS